MTKAELFEIIAGGENSGVEFKRDDVQPGQLAKECVALLNLKGGFVLLGVEDNGDITGLTREDTGTWLMDTVFSKYIDPVVIPYYQEINTEEGRVGVIELSQGISKPYAVKKRGREDVYVRMHDTSQLATREQKIRLMQEGGLLHVETLPVNGTTIDDLDLERFKWYYEKFYEEDFTKVQLDKLLTNLDFGVSKDDGTIVLTIAGNLLFGKQPSRKLPQAEYRIIAYPGKEADLDAVFDETIDSPVVAVRNGNEVVKSGLIDRIFDKLQSLITKEILDESGHRREREWQYPREVLRELIVNSIAHRDWTKFSKNKIELFEDRIEITSAGSIPNNQTIEKMLEGVQYSRNQRLVAVLREIGEMEERGMGIRRRVLPTLKALGFSDPQFRAAEDYFKVIIFKKNNR